MPRRKEAPEYNKPEQDFIRGHYALALIFKKREDLCNRCRVKDCLLIPITTKGEDCPYFRRKKHVES